MPLDGILKYMEQHLNTVAMIQGRFLLPGKLPESVALRVQ